MKIELPSARAAIAAVSLAALAATGNGQASQHALRFHGTGAGQADRLRIRVDDDRAGSDASAPCDVGADGFTLELWVRGALEDNASASHGGDASTPDASWRDGNVLLDRDIQSGSERDFGVSLAGGLVRFGTGAGDSGTNDPHTLEGSTPVLDGAWHHVACVRDAASGVVQIYVDGVLDHESAPGTSTADLSYPDDGTPGSPSPWEPFLVLGAEKHDEGPQHPSFHGDVDELRVWSVARTESQIETSWYLLLAPDTPGLAGSWRFEEGVGTLAADSSGAGSPAGDLIAGLPGNGEWRHFDDDPTDTAPVIESPLPPGFQLTTLTSDLDRPTALAIDSGGRLFVGLQDGTILVLRDDALLPDPLIEIPAQSAEGDEGLLALELDPAFDANGFLYVFYVTTEQHVRVSRFELDGDRADLSSELAVWESPEVIATAHHGGGLAFGADGRLYIGTGDQGDSALSQELASPWGKILRLEPDGSIPPDNPFLDVPGAEPAIWARGLRNAFRLRVDQADGKLWIGDVGGNGSNAWEEVLAGLAGANYGWPFQAGPSCYVPNCAAFQTPSFAYRHDDHDYHWEHDQGCVILGPVYRSTVFPPEYRGDMFIGDFANRWIRRLRFDELGNLTGEQVFLASPDAGQVVDLRQGPEGALYWVTYGTPAGAATGAVGAVHRVSYGVGGNQSPVVHATAAPVAGLPPLEVRFSSSGSFDPDGGPSALTFAWDFGDGGASSESAPTHTFAAAGVYSAVLTLDDGAAHSASDAIVLEVGNPPLATILQPLEGTTYRAGDEIVFAGEAADIEDGLLPESALSWFVELVHEGHAHPFLGPIEGTAVGSFTVPLSGHPPEHTAYRVRLCAVDADGLSAFAARELAPLASPLRFESWPAHVPLYLDGQAEATPREYESLVGYVHGLEAPRWHVIKDEIWLFLRWSDDGPRLHDYVAPEGGGLLATEYLRAVEIAIEISIPGEEENAQHTVSAGQAYASSDDPLALCFGRDADGPIQMGLEFELAVPRNALVLSAVLELPAAADGVLDAVADLWIYNVGNAPIFVAGSPVPLTSWAPRVVPGIRWRPVPAFALGQSSASPELAALLQKVVDRPDWTPGNRVGFVLDGSPSSLETRRSVHNFASGSPARLRVRYAVPAPFREHPRPR